MIKAPVQPSNVRRTAVSYMCPTAETTALLYSGLIQKRPLHLVQIEKAGGRTPRDILVLKDMLLSANQDSNTITCFYRNEDTGIPDAGGRERLSVMLCLPYCRPHCIAPLASSIPPLNTLPFRLSILRAEARITF